MTSMSLLILAAYSGDLKVGYSDNGKLRITENNAPVLVDDTLTIMDENWKKVSDPMSGTPDLLQNAKEITHTWVKPEVKAVRTVKFLDDGKFLVSWEFEVAAGLSAKYVEFCMVGIAGNWGAVTPTGKKDIKVSKTGFNIPLNGHEILLDFKGSDGEWTLQDLRDTAWLKNFRIRQLRNYNGNGMKFKYQISFGGDKKDITVPVVNHGIEPTEIKFTNQPGVIDNNKNGCIINFNNNSISKQLIAVADVERKVTAQQKLIFRVKGMPGNSQARMNVTIVYAENNKLATSDSPLFSLGNGEFKTIIFGLDSDLKLSDATYDLKQIKFVLNVIPNQSGASTAVEIEGIRIVNADEVTNANADFIVIPKQASPQKTSGLVKVWFDFDNDDFATKVISRRATVLDNAGNNSFRATLLENTEDIISMADSAEKADVIVYSCVTQGETQNILNALKSNKRVIVYGIVHDAQLSALLPMALTDKNISGFPVRLPLKLIDKGFPLLNGQILNNGDFGQYHNAKLKHGNVILAFEDGTPFLVEDGKILQFINGIGPAILPSSIYYDKFLLRLIAMDNPAALKELDKREQSMLLKNLDKERTLVAEVLKNSNIAPDKRTGFKVGMSEQNFGRFGWLIGEGLTCDNIGRDLTVTNGNQAYRFDIGDKLIVSGLAWKHKVLKGEVKFSSSTPEETDPTESWSGIGEVEYFCDVVFDQAWKGKKIYFEVKKGIDDIDVTSLNNIVIGKTDEKVKNYWETPRRYLIDESIIKWGQPNRLSVKVTNLRDDAGFNSRPAITIANEGESPELTVEAADWISKKYQIKSGKQTIGMQFTLLAPFIRYTFAQSEALLSQDNIAEFAAYSTDHGIKIVNIANNPKFYDLTRDGKWNEPYLFLFRSKKGNPLLLVFEKQPAAINAIMRKNIIENIAISSDKNLGAITVGWPWGVTTQDSASRVSSLDKDVQQQIGVAVKIATNLPVSCDEVFALQGDEVTIVNRFKYAPIINDWNTAIEPFTSLPPMMALAMQQKNLVKSNWVTNFNINTKYGPTLGKFGSDTISYTIPKPPIEDDYIIVDINDNSKFHDEVNDIFSKAIRYSRGGKVPFDAFTPGHPLDGLDAKNIDLFSWNFGMTTMLQGYFLINPENKLRLENRCRIRYISPIELYQYKDFVRFREEPFTKLRYPIMFNSFYTNSTVYQDGFGSKVIYGDSNEACTVAVWVAQQLSDVFGQAGLVRSNWSFFKQIMRQNLYIDDYAFHSGSCREFGVGAWIDMLNCEYPGMVCFARLAALVQDKDMEEQATYRAAKKMIPTLMRLSFKEYIARSVNEQNVQELGIVTGFGEEGFKNMRFPSNNFNFINAMDLFDFSQGYPGCLNQLYLKYADAEVKNYLNEYAIPSLVKSGKGNIMTSPYFQPLAMLYHNTNIPLENWALETLKIKGDFLRNDWPGVCTPFQLGAVIWNKHNAPAISEIRDSRLLNGIYDPMLRQMTLELDANSQALLVLGKSIRPQSVICNGRSVEVKVLYNGFKVPLNVGRNEISVKY